MGSRRASRGGFPFLLHKVVREMNQERHHGGSGGAYAWLICLVIFLSYMLVYFHRLCPSVLALDMQRDFAVSGTLLGLLGSAYFYPYGLMQIPVGMLADSWGPRKTVASFLLITTAGSMLMGATGALSWAVVGRVLVGVGVSAIYVCNFKLLTEWFPPRQMVLVGGVFMAMGGVGALGAATPLALMSEHLGWRLTLVVVGGLSLVMALAVWLVVRDRPLRPETALDPEDRPAAEFRAPAARIGLWASLREVWGNKRMWPFCAWYFFCVGMAFAIGSMWSVPYLRQVYHMDQTQASFYQNAFGISLIVGAPLLSWLSNRLGRKAVMVMCSLGTAVPCAAFYFFTDSLPPWLIYVMFLLLFGFGTAQGPVAATYSRELARPEVAGTSVGMGNFFPFLGSGVFQVIFGWQLSRSASDPGQYTTEGYASVFGLSLLLSLISLALTWFMVETLPRAERMRKA